MGRLITTIRLFDMTTTFHPKFGQLVENPHASANNPHKFGYFVEVIRHTGCANKGTWYRCTDGRGNFWQSSEIVPSVHKPTV